MEAKTDTKSLQEDLDAFMKADREAVLEFLTPDIESLADKDVAGGLISRDAAIQKHRQELDEKLCNHKTIETLAEGFDLIGKRYPELLSSEEQAKYREDFKICLQQLAQLAGGAQPSEDIIFIPQNVFKVSDFLMYCFQRVAFDFYQKKELESSKCVYSVLVALNPSISDYVVSLALVCEELNEIEDATKYAILGISVDEGNPRNHLVLARLLHKRGDDSLAMDALNDAEKLIAADSPLAEEFKQLKAELNK